MDSDAEWQGSVRALFDAALEYLEMGASYGDVDWSGSLVPPRTAGDAPVMLSAWVDESRADRTGVPADVILSVRFGPYRPLARHEIRDCCWEWNREHRWLSVKAIANGTYVDLVYRTGLRPSQLSPKRLASRIEFATRVAGGLTRAIDLWLQDWDGDVREAVASASQLPAPVVIRPDSAASAVVWDWSRRVWAGTDSGEVLTWEVASDDSLSVAQRRSGTAPSCAERTQVFSLAADPRTGRVAAGTSGAVHIFPEDRQSMQGPIRLDAPDDVAGLAWDPSSGRLAAACSTVSVFIPRWQVTDLLVWDAASLQRSAPPDIIIRDDALTFVACVAFNNEGWLAAATANLLPMDQGAVVLWSPADLTVERPHTGEVGTEFSSTLAWSHDGWLATSGDDSDVAIWMRTTWTGQRPHPHLFLSLDTENSRHATALAWGARDDRLAVGMHDGRLIVWAPGSIRSKNGPRRPTYLNDFGSRVRSLAWSAQGDLAVALDDGRLLVWPRLDFDQ